MTRNLLQSMLFGAAVWYGLAIGGAVPAFAEATDEYQVKAAYLYNFAKFTEWPQRAFSNPDAPLTFCVIGDDLFGAAFDALRSKSAKGRKVATKKIREPREGMGCHVLFISPTDEDRMDEIVSTLKAQPVLVVGDTERFAKRGGMIGFLMERNKVVFEINESAAKRAGIQLSSQILKLARVVY